MEKGKLFLIRLFLVIFIGIGSVGIRFNHQRNITIEKVEYHLSKIGVQKDVILSKDVKYDLTVGEYYIEITYKDEPETRYDYIYRPNQKGLPSTKILVLEINPGLIPGKHAEPLPE